jgi:hypothetical protein
MDPSPTSAAIFASLRITDDRAHAGTGGVLWGGTKAGLALLDYLRACAPPPPLRVLSLGSGLGALELVCACQGAAVLATDLPMVAPLLQRNLADNAPAVAAGGGRLEFEPLDWTAPALPPAIAARGPFAYALASDCVFWPELFAPLARTMARLASCQPAPLPFFLLIEPRSPRELAFLAALEAEGFVYSKLDERHSPLLAGAVSSACAIFVATLVVGGGKGA